ncbi:Homolog of E. coli HemY protein [Georgfuchsia toluolica]|uniref:Homolog of E. coli HemY protein n=1 Tax=Georgfuchsia toluolica TaxID=424218 RepID=A0A916N9L7_9PROT|nr:heme biosynthesis HemY N-terminal domain-containing protein [Georgfuchsia toluolica]CAG4884140.1 Homolog of E. coli HemY protein [Georgfuchsia toluolica]
MRALLWLLILAALAAGLSLAALNNGGYVLLALPPWRAELSLNLMLILTLLGFFLFYLFVRSFGALIALPASVREFRRHRAHETADSALREAVIMSMEGRYSRALRLAEISFDAGHAPLLAALLAQHVAHRMRDEERETIWRQKARASDPHGSGARLMIEAGIAADKRDYAAALELLEEFTRTGGRHVAAQRLLLRVYQGLGQWREVERVVRQLKKHKAMTAEQAAPLRHRAQREILGQLKVRGETGAELEHFLRALPESDRLEPGLVLHAAPILCTTENHAEAARLIEDALDAHWDSDLAAAYGDCKCGDTLARIAHAERWLHVHPGDAKLLLALGRLCRRQQLWGKAQSYLEASLSVQSSRWAHLELAALLDQLGQETQANAHYRAAAGEFSQ